MGEAPEIEVDLAVVTTHLQLDMIPLTSNSLRVRQNGENAIPEEFASRNLPFCIEDIGCYDNRVTKKLTNSLHGDFVMTRAYQYNTNAEIPCEELNYQIFYCSHGKDCCKQECIKDSYLRNVDRITKIFPTQSQHQQWLWPFCTMCNIWIFRQCFTSCVYACLPIEPILINREKNQCNCLFTRVCTAHLSRFNGYFENSKQPTCPPMFSSKRSNNPLQEWSGLPSEKRFRELEDIERENINITL